MRCVTVSPGGVFANECTVESQEQNGNPHGCELRIDRSSIVRWRLVIIGLVLRNDDYRAGVGIVDRQHV